VSATARYTDAQLGALRALGLVPWVRRETVGRSAARAGRPSSLDAEVVPEVPAPAGPAPAQLSALPDWLLPQRLAGFARRGERRYEQGAERSRLLVLADAATAASDLLPLTAPEAELVDAMLRAIELPRADYAIASLHAERAGPPDEQAPSVAQSLPGRAAVLWLSHDAAAAGSERFDIGGVPAFRAPHPARLLSRPLEKRQAWHTLKALRQHLTTP